MTDLIIQLQSLGHFILETMIKGLVISVFFLWLANQLQGYSAATRRLVWLCYFGVLGISPFLILLPIATIEIAVLPAENPFASADPSLLITDAVIWVALAASLYLLIVSFGLLKLALNHFRLYRLAQQASNMNRHTDEFFDQSLVGIVKISQDIETPCTRGYLKPLILLPVTCRNWNSETWKLVIAHEFSHIQQADWLCMTLAQIVRVLFFPIFVVKYTYRKLCFEIENSVDDMVLDSHHSNVNYAQLLVDFSCSPAQNKQTNVICQQPGIVERLMIQARVGRLLNPFIPRGTVAWPETTATIIFIVGFMACVSSLKLTAKNWPLELHHIEFTTTRSLPGPDTITNSTDAATKLYAITSEAPRAHTLPDYNVMPSASLPSLTASVELPVTTNLSEGFIQKEGVKSYLLKADIQPPVFTKPLLTHWKPPTYPLKAKRQHKEATVSVAYDVNTQGSVTNIQILDANQSRWFGKSVIRALKTAVFVPKTIDGTPVYTSNQNQIFRFSLKAHNKIETPDTS